MNHTIKTPKCVHNFRGAAHALAAEDQEFTHDWLEGAHHSAMVSAVVAMCSNVLLPDEETRQANLDWEAAEHWVGCFSRCAGEEAERTAAANDFMQGERGSTFASLHHACTVRRTRTAHLASLLERRYPGMFGKLYSVAFDAYLLRTAAEE